MYHSEQQWQLHPLDVIRIFMKNKLYILEL